MASQSIKTIKAALVTQINTEVSDFNLVTDVLRHSDHYGSGKYPICIIRLGGFTHNKNLTRTESIDVQILISIIGKQTTTSDEIEDLYEATVDAINTDLTIGETCIHAMTAEAEAAAIYPRDQKFILNAMILCTYWRDITGPTVFDFLLLESGNYVLLETGDKILLD